MYVRRIVVRRAPGLDHGVTVDGLAAGLHVIVGANASGKSTLARTLREALWSKPVDTDTWAEVEVVDAANTSLAKLSGGRVQWAPTPPSGLPEDDQRYALGLAELLEASETDHALAHQIAIEIAGGDDPEAACAHIGDRSLRPRNLMQAVDRARAAVQKSEAEADGFAADEARLAALDVALEASRDAAHHLKVVQHLQASLDANAGLAAARAELATLPLDLDGLKRDAVAELGERAGQVRERQKAHALASERLQGAMADVEASSLGDDDGAFDAWLRQAAEAIRAGDDQRGRADAAARDVARFAAEARTFAGRIFREPQQGDDAATEAFGAPSFGVAARGVAALGDAARGDDAPDDDAAEQIGDLVDRRAAERAKLDAATAGVQLWQHAAGQLPETMSEAEAMRFVAALRRWQHETAAAPPPHDGATLLGLWARVGAAARIAAIVVFLLAAIAALAQGVTGLALVAGVGLAAILLAWAIEAQLRQPTGDPATAARQAQAMGARPQAWTHDAVEAEIDRLFDQRAAIAVRARIREQAAGFSLAQREADAGQRAAAAAVSAAERALGLAEGLTDTATREQAARLLSWRRALAQRDAVAQQRDGDLHQAALRFAEAADLLARFGVDVPAPIDVRARAQSGATLASATLAAATLASATLATASTALARSLAIAQRLVAQQRAHVAALDLAVATTERVWADLSDARRVLARTWQRAGVEVDEDRLICDGAALDDALATVAARVAALDDFHAATTNRAYAQRELARLRALLATQPAHLHAVDALCARHSDAANAPRFTPWVAAEDDDEARDVLDALDVDAAAILQRVADDLEAVQRQAAAAHQERGGLNERLSAAGAATALADALAARTLAEAELLEARDDAIERLLACWLIERARDEAARRNATPMLQAAQSLFATFTHDTFALHIEPDGSLSASASDGSEPRQLWALSDATRVHLLLALRLAALAQHETSCGPLPICLDEVLSTTDPRRFGAVASALCALARDGRQVLYLTSDPAEAAALVAAAHADGAPAPTVHHLGQSDVEPLPPAPLLVASPNARRPGEPAATWLARLHVPRLELWQPAESVHLAWLMPDLPDALAALVDAGIDHVGAFTRADAAGRAAARMAGKGGGAESAAAATVRARIEALNALLAAVRVGRPRPATWQDVEQSGAITPAFIERAHDVWQGTAGDGGALIAAIAALPRFRSNNVEQLRDHLWQIGALTEETPLDGRQCRQRVVDAVVDAHEVTAAEIEPLLGRWLVVLTAPASA